MTELCGPHTVTTGVSKGSGTLFPTGDPHRDVGWALLSSQRNKAPTLLGMMMMFLSVNVA